MRFTRKRPFSCWHCDWVGWVVPDETHVGQASGLHHDGASTSRPSAPDDRPQGPHFFATVPVDPKQPAVAGSPHRR